MRIYVCSMVVAVLSGVCGGGAMESVLQPEPGLLIATERALADLQQLCVSLTTHENRALERLISLPALEKEAAEKLDEAGITPVDSEPGQVPRLVVQIEGLAVPDCGSYVWRVATSLNRTVMFPDQRERRLEAAVWRLQPKMELVELADVGETIRAAVLTQVDAFIGLHEAARKLGAGRKPVERNRQELDTLSPVKSTGQDLQGLPAYPFVASRNSSVFHRADCRWAQKIAEANRVGYKTREEALQDGKRPCKFCKP